MLLAGSCKKATLALAVSLVVSGGAWAQTEATGSEDADLDSLLEEIVVKGIRRSISTSIDVKRRSINSVDAIAAEDVGKMPDQNVAESLQRIPGVTIERNRGDGQFVSVRGLGPDFNAVTVNGRTLATDNIGRAFSFDVLPSELITGAEVYKSPMANINGASIGATINIKTVRPLEQDDGFVGVINAKLNKNDLADSTNPSLSGLLSYKNDEGTFGAALALSFVEREIRTDDFTIGAGHTPRSSTEGGYFNGRTGPGIEEFENVDAPSNLSPFFIQREDERTGINAALQFMPNENMTHTIDLMYTKLDQDTKQTGVAYDFSGGTIVEQVIEDNSIVQQRIENGFVDEIIQLQERPAETQLIGYNFEWVRGQVTMDFDLSYSEATIDDPVNDWFTTIRRTGMDLEFDRRSGHPIYDFAFSNPNYADAATDVNNIGGHYVNIGGSALEDTTLEYSFDIKWEGDDGLSAYAGLSIQNREKIKEAYGIPFSVQCAFCGGEAYVPMPSELFSSTGYTWFEDFGGTAVRDWIDYDPKAYVEALRAFEGPYVPWLETNGYEDPTPAPEQSSNVEEDVITAYLMFDYETELAGRALAINTGVRVESTEFTSSGAAQTILSARPNGQGQNIIEVSDVVPVGFDGSYTDVLPSLNIRYNLSDELIARFAASRVMTRPTLDDLSPAQSILTNPGNESIVRGNPDLDPFRASQMDLGLEWYFSEYGVLSASLFFKSIDSFVSSRTTPELVDQVVFQVTVPENGDGAEVRGLELGYRQVFDFLPEPFDGFGVEASYTRVSSDAEFNNEVTGVSYGLEGLSENSYSLVGFYEKGALQARLAYTYRDEFLQVAFGRNGDPEFFDDYDQLDASISFEVMEDLTLSLEALNLTESEEFIYSTTRDRTKEYRTTGRRFVAGVRYRF